MTIIVPLINITGIKELKLHLPLLNANMCLLLIYNRQKRT